MNLGPDPAERYTPCSDLWCLTAYFNPAGYTTRRANYDRFATPIRAAGIPLLTIEFAVGDTPFDLPPDPGVIQIRGPHAIWQKERLLNLGVDRLPPAATKVAWLDNDILFTNPDWAVETAALLDRYPVGQPFQRAFRLQRGALTTRGDELVDAGFAATVGEATASLGRLSFRQHGHTGFAWAARREPLARLGLYEHALPGNGDHLMAHAMAGDFDGYCMWEMTGFGPGEHTLSQARQHRLYKLGKRLLPTALVRRLRRQPLIKRPYPPFRDHVAAWGRPWAEVVGGRFGHTAGEVLHLWHGHLSDRGHQAGRLSLFQLGFDPAEDLRTGPTGCLEWATDRPELRQWGERFFAARQEDGA